MGDRSVTMMLWAALIISMGFLVFWISTKGLSSQSSSPEGIPSANAEAESIYDPINLPQFPVDEALPEVPSQPVEEADFDGEILL